jgi:hypothetical protein
MTRADSMRQTASMIRWISEAGTASDHTTLAVLLLRQLLADLLVDLDSLVLAEVLQLEHLPDFDLAVDERRAPRPFDSLFPGLRLDEPEATPSFRKRPVDDSRFAALEVRAPFELACRPSPASIIPFLTICSLNLPISASSFALGSTPASDSFDALTMSMKRIG